MSRQLTHPTAWKPMVDQTAIKSDTGFVFDEPNRIVPDDGGNPLRGLLIGLAMSAALWATVGGGIWFVLPLSV